jgi:hypothetical protein
VFSLPLALPPLQPVRFFLRSMLGSDATVARLKEQISVLEDQSRTCEDKRRVLRTSAAALFRQTVGLRTRRNTCTSRRTRERKSCVGYFTSSIGYHILPPDSRNNTLVKRVQ